MRYNSEIEFRVGFRDHLDVDDVTSMGNTSKPVSSRIRSSEWELEYACTSVQGLRQTMEDRYDVRVCRLPPAAFDSPSSEVAAFAVYDGHIGVSAVEFVKRKMINAVLSAHLLSPSLPTAWLFFIFILWFREH